MRSRTIALWELQAKYRRQHLDKLPFTSKAEADEMAKVMEEKSGIPQHSYHCAFCSAWHVGADMSRSRYASR